MLDKGFYTAMGTSLNSDGSLCKEGLKAHIENQIENGAAGIFIMGTMGMQPAIKNDVYADVAKLASETVNGRASLLIGVMDNSVARVIDRINSLKGLDLTGVVATAPFFCSCGGNDLTNFFTMIADKSEFPLYLYDQPGITNVKITTAHISDLAKHPNIKGIKTADINLVRYIKNNFPDFEILYSHSDYYGAAAAYGVDKFLEGMFACTPKNAKKVADNFNSGNTDEAIKYLKNILELRDLFIKYRVNPSLTVCLNEMGINGIFHPDYHLDVPAEAKTELVSKLKEIGEV